MDTEHPEATPNSSPRVFHRGKGTLVLLWDRLEGEDPTSAVLTVKNLSNPQDRERVVPLAAITYEGEFYRRVKPRLDANTVVCEINEEVAMMSRRDDYYVKIKQGELSQSVKVYQAGVKRPFEGEDQERNVHLLAWDKSRTKWRKLDGEQLADGRFGLVVVTKGSCDQCGYDPNRKETN